MVVDPAGPILIGDSQLSLDAILVSCQNKQMLIKEKKIKNHSMSYMTLFDVENYIDTKIPTQQSHYTTNQLSNKAIFTIFYNLMI